MGIVELIKRELKGRFFLHFPYPIERPYDNDYQITWIHYTDSLLFLELEETKLLTVCNPKYHLWVLFGDSALYSTPPRGFHLFYPAQFKFDLVGVEDQRARSPESQEVASVDSQTCNLLRNWLSQCSWDEFTIELQDDMQVKKYYYRVKSPKLLHFSADYALAFFGRYLCLWRGRDVTITTSHEALAISKFDHCAVADIVGCRFVPQTTVSGSLRFLCPPQS